MTSFWSGYIIVLTVITIIATALLLFGNRTRPADSQAKTGHVYDGIEEYDNPLPAWWLYLFVATIVFAIGYLVAFPGLGNFPGLLGWSGVGQWEGEVAEAEQKYEPIFAAYRDKAIADIAADPQAVRMGQRIFATECAQCHGADARGAQGFPNLTDKDWIWGGDADTIHTTIVNGRVAAMPAWGAALGEEGVRNVARYVLSLSDPQAAGAEAQAGAQQFATFCSACHGPEGKGNPMLGAPNLGDTTWLYGGDQATIERTLRDGRNGRMPAFGQTLNADKVRLVAAYVYSLSQ
ncbi:MAG: cytochrome-c oxidase, cbb3-type subunit III [Pseudomonadales bacterium]|jgi:cytochrome c oxidase cbb3-type subunit 3|nr:cytochrome-c oxidase, cbb3-type subunit III [Pseudomonadales bacterium]MCP5320791.1 cytochrome-c oxidase, cbb3-type subunit III [Pseudomonadales bacterium]MCP5337590.1 cytochrome-c oxidase, cbb3-type subunit III [Pseudomonadales bacterium]